MFLNNFSLRIVGGDEVPGGYVQMQHGQTYQLSLRNDHSTRCDAYVEIDGKHIGTWRIGSHDSILIERPAHDTGKFTFYQVGSSEAQQVGQSSVAHQDRGLVKVVFTPEKAYAPPSFAHYVAPSAGYYTQYKSIDDDDVPQAAMSSNNTRAEKSVSSGVTGLSGHSNQTFSTVGALNYDMNRQTTIFLRLVVVDNGPRPLTQYSTPIPPSV